MMKSGQTSSSFLKPREASAPSFRTLFLIPIRAYRRMLSPFLGARCRFVPSCSAYAEEAVAAYGAVKGVRLAMARLLRCHPWHPGGYDPLG